MKAGSRRRAPRGARARADRSLRRGEWQKTPGVRWVRVERTRRDFGGRLFRVSFFVTLFLRELAPRDGGCLSRRKLATRLGYYTSRSSDDSLRQVSSSFGARFRDRRLGHLKRARPGHACDVHRGVAFRNFASSPSVDSGTLCSRAASRFGINVKFRYFVV